MSFLIRWLALCASVLLVLFVLVTAKSAFGYVQHSFIDDTASWLAMRDVDVRCLSPRESADDPVISFWGAAAYVEGWSDAHERWHPYDYAVFAFGHCEPLMALKNGREYEWDTDDLAWALMALTHESGHLRGHRWSADEAKTQCWAIRHTGYTARRFGVTEENLPLIMASALHWHSQLPSEYQLQTCQLPRP